MIWTWRERAKPPRITVERAFQKVQRRKFPRRYHWESMLVDTGIITASEMLTRNVEALVYNYRPSACPLLEFTRRLRRPVGI